MYNKHFFSTHLNRIHELVSEKIIFFTISHLQSTELLAVELCSCCQKVDFGGSILLLQLEMLHVGYAFL